MFFICRYLLICIYLYFHVFILIYEYILYIYIYLYLYMNIYIYSHASSSVWVVVQRRHCNFCAIFWRFGTNLDTFFDLGATWTHWYTFLNEQNSQLWMLMIRESMMSDKTLIYVTQRAISLVLWLFLTF